MSDVTIKFENQAIDTVCDILFNSPDVPEDMEARSTVVRALASLGRRHGLSIRFGMECCNILGGSSFSDEWIKGYHEESWGSEAEVLRDVYGEAASQRMLNAMKWSPETSELKPATETSVLKKEASEGREVTMKELLSRPQLAIESLPFLKEKGIVLRGFSHLISGLPKAGKTELLTSVCKDWLHAGEKILYFTEEPESIWRDRGEAGFPATDDFRLYFGMGMGWQKIADRINAGDENIAVIDTVRSLVALDDENDNSLVTKATTPIISAARQRGMSLLMTHHLRKTGGDYGTAISGAGAFAGIVDVLIEIERSGRSNERMIKVMGRRIAEKRILYAMTTPGQFELRGAPEDRESGNVKERVFLLLTTEFQTTATLTKHFSGCADVVLDALNDLAREGQALRNPPINEGGKQGKAYQWKLPIPLS